MAAGRTIECNGTAPVSRAQYSDVHIGILQLFSFRVALFFAFGFFPLGLFGAFTLAFGFLLGLFFGFFFYQFLLFLFFGHGRLLSGSTVLGNGLA
jgi:hypothetical protein